MKAQFKYAFLSGIYVRGSVFAAILIMNTVFITLGSLGLLVFAAHVTAVALGGVAIAVMMAFNIMSDIAIARRMFFAPEAYLYALTPAPRWKTLFASIAAMAAMDIITMAVVITSQVWLSFNLAGVWHIVQDSVRTHMNASNITFILWSILLLIAGYLLIITLILFCVTAKKSILYKKPASGLMAFLLAFGCLYAVSLLQLLLAPFGDIQRYGIFIFISLGSQALPAYILLTLLEAAGLFILTSKLMEKRINI